MPPTPTSGPAAPRPAWAPARGQSWGHDEPTPPLGEDGPAFDEPAWPPGVPDEPATPVTATADALPEPAPDELAEPTTDGLVRGAPWAPLETTLERLQRLLLGAELLALDATRRARVLGWVWPLAVTVFGGILRFSRLAVPHKLVFDETYYVKQGWSMVTLGYEAKWGEGMEADQIKAAFEAGDLSILGTNPEYVVHPPIGKWVIGLGIQLAGGPLSSFAWRFSVALLGTLAILVLARTARRLFASTALGTLAGLFLAVDGEALVQSRTSLLDPVLMFFVLTAFAALVLDREQARRRLAQRVADELNAGRELVWGPRLGARWWRILATVLLGLACGTKWSGIYFLAVFGVMTVWWDVSARRTAGVRHWFASGLFRDGVPAFLTMVPGTIAVYLASWSSWFATSGGWDRNWAAGHPGEGVQWLPPALRSLWKYHTDMWNFHNTLDTPHPYQSYPLGWLIQWRPTSFFYPKEVSELKGQAALDACGATHCSWPVLSVGNPIIWWAAAAAALVAVWWLLRYRDWRAAAVLSGTAAGWLPWFAYAHRTIFTFYSVAFVPWVVLTLVYVLGLVIGRPDEASAQARRRAIIGVAAFAALVVAVGMFFYPVWTAWVMPYDFWHIHIWMPRWV